MNKALEYAREHREAHRDQLFDLLRIPSISTDPDYADDVQRAAEWLRDELTRIGMERARVMETAGLPIVYAEWLGAGEDAQTVLIYGHYDVQPVDPLDLWESDPFDPQIRDGKIVARGAADDKGQAFIHLKAIESILEAEGSLPVNVKVLLEGEEEIGSPSIEAFVLKHADLLAADSVLISDTEFLNAETPMLVYGLRGLTYMEVRISGPSHDLHSGSFGGTVYNPAQVIAEIITKLHNEDATVAIPGFYDKVRTLTPEEREAMAAIPYSLEEWQSQTGLEVPWGEADYNFVERRGARPTCEVNGIWGGYSGDGSKTIIPAAAGAKVSMRLVPDQDPDEIARLFTDYVQQIAPEHVTVEVENLNGGWPAITPIDSAEMRAAAKAYETVFGAAPVFSREGGSIPIVATFQKELGAPSVLMGFSVPGSFVHAPNEHFHEAQFYKGIETVIHYYANLAQ